MVEKFELKETFITGAQIRSEGVTYESITIAGAETKERAIELATESIAEFNERNGTMVFDPPPSSKAFSFSNWSGSKWQPEGTLKKPWVQETPPGFSKPELN